MRRQVERRGSESADTREHVAEPGQRQYRRIPEAAPWPSHLHELQLHQLARIAHRQRPQQQRVDQAEDRRVRPDPERHTQHRRRGEPCVISQCPRRITHVLRRLFGPPPGPHCACLFPHQRRVSECLVRRQPVSASLLGLQLEVRIHLALQFPLASAFPEHNTVDALPSLRLASPFVGPAVRAARY